MRQLKNMEIHPFFTLFLAFACAIFYNRSKISRISWLFKPKCRNNAELTYILLPCIAIYYLMEYTVFPMMESPLLSSMAVPSEFSI